MTAPTAPTTAPLSTRDAPYVGPRPIPGDRPLYGRDRELRRLLDTLIPERIVLLYSPSGAGKTSLLQAALLPALRQKNFLVRGPIRVNLDPSTVLPEERASQTEDGRPINRYVLSALLSLDALDDDPAVPRRTPAELAGLDLASYLELGLAPDARRRPEVLVFDQFEEILTLDPTDYDAKVAFFEQVGRALRDEWRWALFAMREDYIAALDPFLDAVPTRFRARFRLDLLGERAAREAMQRPAADAGYVFTDAAASRLADDLRRVRFTRPSGGAAEGLGQHVEPVQLQVVCLRIWKQLAPDTREIGLAEIERYGNVDTALADYYADSVRDIAARTGVQERLIRRWVEEHLTTGDNFRCQVVEQPGRTHGLDNAVLAELEDAHLVRRDRQRGVRWYELTHDRLVQPIRESNAAWFAANLSLLQREAEVWDRHGRQDELLVGGAALAEVERWAAEHPDLLADVERQFLGRCRERRDRAAREAELEVARRARDEADRRREAAEREQEAARLREELAVAEAARATVEATRARQRFRLVVALVSVIAVSAVVALTLGGSTAYFGLQSSRNERAAAVATSRLLAVQVEPLLHRYDLALLLGVEARRLDDSPETRGSLLTAVAHNPRLTRYLPGHRYGVKSVAVSPDGRLIASGSRDDQEDSTDEGSVRLWDAATGRPVGEPLAGHAWGLAFSPDGRYLASGRPDGTISVWDVGELPAREWRLLAGGHQRAVTSLAFTTDGGRLISASRDGSVVVWRLEAGQPDGAPLRLTDAEAWGVAVQPDGRLLAVGGSNGRVVVWNLATRRPALPPLPYPGWVRAVAFTPSGDHLLAAGAGGIVQAWDTTSWQRRPDLVLAARNTILGLAVSPDGRTVVAAGVDGYATLWDLASWDTASGRDEAPLRGHTDWIWSVAFGPDGRTLVTGGADRMTIIWDREARWGRPLEPASDPLRTVAFSADGATVAAAGDARQVLVWERRSGRPLPTLDGGHQGAIRSIAFSPTAPLLASGGDDNLVVLWDWQAAVPTARLAGHTGDVTGVAFSPDGALLASIGCVSGASCREIEIWLWDAASRQPTARLTVPRSGGAWSVAFSPDGKTLAAAVGIGPLALFDVPSRRLLGELGGADGHKGQVWTLAFSPDGKTLVSGSVDGRVILWDVAERRWLADSLIGTGRSVWGVAFQPPDGLLFAVANGDGTIGLRDARSGDRVGPIIAAHEEGTRAVAFSPDGATLASAGLDGRVILWDTSADAWQARACQAANRNLTEAEWRKYLGERPYRETCPR